MKQLVWRFQLRGLIFGCFSAAPQRGHLQDPPLCSLRSCPYVASQSDVAEGFWNQFLGQSRDDEAFKRDKSVKSVVWVSVTATPEGTWLRNVLPFLAKSLLVFQRFISIEKPSACGETGFSAGEVGV